MTERGSNPCESLLLVVSSEGSCGFQGRRRRAWVAVWPAGMVWRRCMPGKWKPSSKECNALFDSRSCGCSGGGRWPIRALLRWFSRAARRCRTWWRAGAHPPTAAAIRSTPVRMESTSEARDTRTIVLDVSPKAAPGAADTPYSSTRRSAKVTESDVPTSIMA